MNWPGELTSRPAPAQLTDQRRSTRRSTLVGSYILGDEIGKGAYGQVYKAIDKRDGRVVAIKEIPLAGIDEASLAGVRLEIDLLGSLSHPNVVGQLGTIRTPSYFYIVLEYCEAGSLAASIKANKFGPAPEALCKVYVAQVLDALAYLHSPKNGIVHRDVKGANLLATKDGCVKLADFGSAARMGEDGRGARPGLGNAPKKTGGGSVDDDAPLDVVGTPYWMAPEVIEMSGTKSDPKSDVWSVACVVVELLTGSPPYFDLQPMPALFAIVRDESPPLPPGISPELRGFLTACFRKDPAQRPTASELRSHEWLEGVATEGAAATVSSSGPARRAEHLALDDPKPDSAASSLAGSGRSSPAHGRPQSGSRGHRRGGQRGDGGDGAAYGRNGQNDGAWEPPGSVADPQRRRRRPPPSSPFQDVKVAMNGDGDVRGGDGDDGITPHNAMTPHNADDAMTSVDSVSVRLEYPNASVPGFDGDVARATRDGRWSDLAGLCSTSGVTAAAKDAALTSAGTAGALTAALHGAASYGRNGQNDDAGKRWTETVETLDAAAAALAGTRRKRADGVDAPGETLAAFVTLGAASSTLTLLATSGDASASASASVGVKIQIAAARVVRELSRGGVVALRCLASCDAPRALAGVLAQSAMSPSQRELARVCVDVARSLTTLHTRAVTGAIPPSEASRMASEPASGISGISSGISFDEEDDAFDARGGGVIFDAFARAGLIPALVNAIRDLNAAANEERGVGPGKKASESEKSESPSSVYRERVADILLDATRSRNDRGCVASRSALCELQAMHGLLALAGSPLPSSTSAKLLRVVGHLARDDDCKDAMKRAGAVPKLVRFLQWEDLNTREEALRALYNLCRGDASALEQAAVAGVTPHLIAVAAPDVFNKLGLADELGAATGTNGGGTHWTKGAGAQAQIERLAPLAAPFLCDMASSSRRTRSELARHDALDAYLSIARNSRKSASSPPGLQLAAVNAVAGWMSDEPWKVEARLAEPDALAAWASVVDPKSTPPVDPEVLHALREMARESPRLCAALASGGAMAPLVEALGAPSSAQTAVSAKATHNAGTVDWNNDKILRRTSGTRRLNPLRRGGRADDPGRVHDARKDPRRTLAYVRLLAQLADHQREAVDERGRGHDLVGRLRALVADYESEASRRVEARALRAADGVDDDGADSERAAENVRTEAERLLAELGR